MYKFDTKKEISQFIATEVVNTPEARAILNNCSRQYINELIEKGKLTPIKFMIGDNIFFKSDVEMLKKKKKRGGLSMSVLKGIINELVIGERKSKIKLDNYVYLKLMEEAKNDNYTAEAIVNKILYERYENIENERKNKEQNSKKDKELTKYYKFLDKYLYSTLNCIIEIGITNEQKGRDEKKYTLLDYSLSKVDKRLSLRLERNNEKTPISFNEIVDIKAQDTGDRLKVWIYMPKDTWRFYLTYSKDIVEKCKNNFNSGKLKIVPEIPYYSKFKNVDNLKYYLEKKKYDLQAHFESEKLVKDKRGEDLYLINFLDKQNNFSYEHTGDIYVVSEFGDEGKLFYSIKHDIFDSKNEDYIEIVDILPERYNIGIGTEVLKYLEEIAIKYNVKHIVGELSPVDFDHKDRLLHFYKKNGYEINGYKLSKNI